MLRSLNSGTRAWPLLLLLFLPRLQAAILPDQIGTFKKGPSRTVSIPDQALYNEYGLQATEQAEYSSPPKHFTVTAWQMHDSTGAMALFEDLRPADATSANITQLAVHTSDGVLFAFDNYVLKVTGDVPDQAALSAFYMNLPELEQSALPALMAFLPRDGLVPNSERYIVGPVSLERFDPKIAPSVAAFHMGSEAQLGQYRTAHGLLTLAIFDYPTPGMAKERYSEFEKIPGAVAKRVGALVAVTIAPPNPDDAERVLAQVRYSTNITWNEGFPVNPAKGVATLILNIFIFCGIVVLLCVIGGVGFGGFRILRRKLGAKEDPNAMITLHLGGK